jgi:ubiquitin-activating enzyme E1
MSFFKQFESKGGVTKIINVSLSSLKLWKNKQMAEHWKMWLEELYSFSQIPLFFQMFLKNQKCKALLF